MAEKINWDAEEEVVVPQGQFIGWEQVGQTITGTVLAYEEDGGSDFNGDPCPQIILTLIEPCVTFRDKGATKLEVDAGELVTITCGQWQLRRKMIAAAPTPHDIVRVEMTGVTKLAKGDSKDFSVRIARRQAPAPAAPKAERSGLFSDGD
jgi:hypothetical protein